MAFSNVKRSSKGCWECAERYVNTYRYNRYANSMVRWIGRFSLVSEKIEEASRPKLLEWCFFK